MPRKASRAAIPTSLRDDAPVVNMPLRAQRRVRFQEVKETRWTNVLRIFGINPTRLVILALLLTASVILIVRAIVLS